jgi:hypothetical protein
MDSYALLMTVLNIAHYIIVPLAVIIALRELFPTQSWAQIQLNLNNWICMTILLYVMKML